jgi:acyl carrier protein
VNLVLAVESRFGVRFTSTEVAALKDVGELSDLVEKKRS